MVKLEKPKVVMLFGTFDMVHEGHRHFFKQAKVIVPNAKLVVSIARDSNVVRIKGKRPSNSQTKRAAQVAKEPEVDKVVLGAEGDHMPHIIKEAPDIIALGYDQTAYVGGLKEQLKAAGLKTKVVRLKPHKPHVYKTSLLKKTS